MTEDHSHLDPRYVAARRVLIDALEALVTHRDALVVVGAQAIYLRTGGAEIGVAPYTTDGDLALDPASLLDEPQLEAAMIDAGFALHEPHPDRPEPGNWITKVEVGGNELIVPVDLIVPAAVAPPGGRRGARLGHHGKRAAHRAVGLEAALVDHSPMVIAALDSEDSRRFEVAVAGCAALLVAKLHKIHDRLASAHTRRVDDKDGGDVYRIMRSTTPSDVAARLTELRSDPIAGPATERAIGYLDELFGTRRGEGLAMAVRTYRIAIPEEQVTAVATTYAARVRGFLAEGR